MPGFFVHSDSVVFVYNGVLTACVNFDFCGFIF